MHQKLSVIRPALVNRKGPILSHDNDRPHVSLITVQKLNDLGYETLQHPPSGLRLLQTPNLDFVDSKPHRFSVNGTNKLATRWQRCIDCNDSEAKVTNSIK
ncbi:Histone-lysine N-methyltransferase SETMAR [Habropoda laboriosa]|uniref:Histone-lysine N-methyltransferase SETMAR n=1 Tax=Habropoda laboriosa TaxID=597456 RepID=A0A0L7RE70_9HYME|nr:Histone-lysine N-methyltransferase SETMAR [Habropoda laboriosa]